MEVMSLYKKCLFALVLGLMSSSSVASNEDWYFMFGIGKSDIQNDTDIESEITLADSSPGVDEFSMGMDLLGIYRPHKNIKELLLGLAIHCDAQFFTEEILSGRSKITDDISTLNYTIALSSLYFPSKEHGKGMFYRGDAGLVRNMVIMDNSDDINEKVGLGALVGLGYGIPISSKTRILISANYSMSFVRGGEYKAGSLMIGGLW